MLGSAAVLLNNCDANLPVFYLEPGTRAGEGCYVEVWAGANPEHLAPLVNTQGQAVFDLLNAGYFNRGAAVVPGVLPHTEASFQPIAWKGQATIDGWQTADHMAKSAVWSQLTGFAYDPPPPDPPVLVHFATLSFPANLVIQPIPEPSIIVFGAMGTAWSLAPVADTVGINRPFHARRRRPNTVCTGAGPSLRVSISWATISFASAGAGKDNMGWSDWGGSCNLTTND